MTSDVNGRDAWSRLGEMSSEAAMTAYVEEMKKVAEEVRGSRYTDSLNFSMSVERGLVACQP